MTNEFKGFVVRLLVFTALIFAIHAYLINQFFDGSLHFPLWAIYIFNAVLVFVVYSILNYQSKKDNKKIFFTFIALSLIKMVLAVIFLLPLFYGKSDHAQLEVINFFASYFLFLTFEIFSINKFLQKL